MLFIIISHLEPHRMDLLLLLAIFFGRKFLVLLLGHPIGIVEGSHCPLKRILGKLAAGKQAGHLTDQFIDVSRCFCCWWKTD